MDGGLFDVQLHANRVQEWKDTCVEKIDHSILKKRRTRQFQAAINDDNICVFIFVRTQTRYRQTNYLTALHTFTSGRFCKPGIT